MNERKAPGLTLPKREFRYFDKAVRANYGKSIAEIVQVEPAFAFQAMRTGLTALFTRSGHRELVQQTETTDAELKTTAVINRELDGEAAFSGSVGHAMDGVVDTLIARYESSDQDFVISVLGNRSLMDRIRRREPVPQVVATIPQSS